MKTILMTACLLAGVARAEEPSETPPPAEAAPPETPPPAAENPPPAAAENPPPAAAENPPPAAAENPPPTVASAQPATKDRSEVLVAVKLGGLFAEPFSRLGASYLVDLEIGYALPVLKHRLAITLEGAFTAPEAEGKSTDARLD